MGAKRSTGEVTHVNQMNKREFLALLESGAATTRTPSNRMDWDDVVRNCKDAQGQEPFNARQFWEIYVEGAVSLQRTRSKLEEFYVQGKLLRIIDPRSNAYYYMWTEKELT